MISEELLSEVLGIEVNDFGFSLYDKSLMFINQTYYTDENNTKHRTGCKKSISIYELAHKCKEWAFKQEYRISSQYVEKGEFTSSWSKVHNLVSADNDFIHRFHANTESEAIFKACQWILEYK